MFEINWNINFLTIIFDIQSNSDSKMLFCYIRHSLPWQHTLMWIRSLTKIKYKSFYYFNIMITVEFMDLHINRRHVFRLRTNITITNAVWLLGTLYINLNFDNLSCLWASVKQTKSYLQEIKVPCNFIPMLVHFLYFTRKLPPVQKRKSIFQKLVQLSNIDLIFRKLS